MDLLKLMLPVLVILPVIFDRFLEQVPRNKSYRIHFIGPIAFIGLTIFSSIKQAPIEVTVWNFSNYFSLGLKLDVLSGLIAITVLTIGLVVTRFSVRYLEDDPERLRFKRNLSYTLSFVLSMLMAPNLAILFICWVGTSYFLHQLLTHFSEREAAVKAAEQKFWISRLGDVFILSAGMILFSVFESLEFKKIFLMVESLEFINENKLSLNVASILIVLGAMTKSAQFPFHFWLPNTMETPTPVSAIMHAGIINAGGYLVIRMSPLLSNSSIALSFLAIVGGFTAFWATIVMFTQPSVKKNLAYSTIAQMGFMMLQCGLGAFSVAIVHTIGHAFYKAYSFLSSGTATDFAWLNRYFPKPKVTQSLWSPFIIAFFIMSLIIGGYVYFGYSLIEKPGVSLLLVILSLAAAQIILNSNDKTDGMIMASVVVSLYLVLTGIMSLLLSGIVPQNTTISGVLGIITWGISASFFIGLYLVQNSLDRFSQTNAGKYIYVKALRGGFL